MSITISGAGCSLIDYLFTRVDFSGPAFSKYESMSPGDGGLTPGKLVFASEFEQFCGRSMWDAVVELTGGAQPDDRNLGGPAIVALITAAQILYQRAVTVEFYGARSNDESGRHIASILAGTPVRTENYRVVEGITPTTVVLSDANFDNGRGERAFINNIGAASAVVPEDLDSAFFESDIVVFGGTALVPRLHDGLTDLCARAQANECFTLVNTVYDFRAERRAPYDRWPLGESDETYRHIDLLIVDHEEGTRLSGETGAMDALLWFRNAGVSAAIITCGVHDFYVYAEGPRFRRLDPSSYPVSQQVQKDIEQGVRVAGDTTGCGDNFVGGVLASVADQLSAGPALDLLEAAAWGVAAGGHACLYVGGTFGETSRGQKRALVEQYYNSYRAQIGLSAI